jgi:thiol-disulfide isomerase/thioredoxin
MDKMRSGAIVAIVALLSFIPAHAQSAAETSLSEAQSRAAGEHKNIFLIFGASWCGPCHQLDAFLQVPETKAIVEKYFVIAKLHIAEEASKHPEWNTPGGDALLQKLTGLDPNNTGVPFIVFVDETGKPIVNSGRPVPGAAPENIGYPVLPEEITWFMEMLKRGAPSMSTPEAQKISAWLRESAQGQRNGKHSQS